MLPIEELADAEKYFIEYYGSFGNGFNFTTGGELYIVSKETIDKRVQSRKGYRHSEETKAKISKSKKGKPLKPFTQEHKDKISK